LKELTGGFPAFGRLALSIRDVESPFVFGTDLNNALSGTNDRPAIVTVGAGNFRRFANSLAGAFGCDASATGYFDLNCNSVGLGFGLDTWSDR